MSVCCASEAAFSSTNNNCCFVCFVNQSNRFGNTTCLRFFSLPGRKAAGTRKVTDFSRKP